MTLADRSRAVADAGRGREAVRAAMLIGGTMAAGIGFSIGNIGLAAAGALTIGLELGQAIVNPERAYMEGFSDGLVTAPVLDERRAAPAGQRRGDPPDVRRLPAGAGLDDGPRVDGAAGPTGGAPASPDRGDARPVTLAGAAGVVIQPGLHRPANDAFSIDARALAQGPRVSPFPVPAAQPTRSPVRVEGSTAGKQTRRRQRSLDQRKP